MSQRRDVSTRSAGIIPFIIDHKKEKFTEFIKYSRRTTDDDGVTDSIEENVPKLPENASPYQVLKFCAQFQEARNNLSWTTGIRLFTIFPKHLRGVHLSVWEIEVANVNRTIQNFDARVQRWKRLILTGYHYENQLGYLRTVSKPASMSPNEFWLNYRAAVQLCLQLPDAPDDATGFTETEFKINYVNAMPAIFKQKFTDSTYDVYSSPLSSIRNYFDNLAAAYPYNSNQGNGNNNNGNNNGGRNNNNNNNGNGNGGRGNRNNRGNRGNRNNNNNQNNRGCNPNDTCYLPGHGNHTNAQCHRQRREREQGNNQNNQGYNNNNNNNGGYQRNHNYNLRSNNNNNNQNNNRGQNFHNAATPRPIYQNPGPHTHMIAPAAPSFNSVFGDPPRMQVNTDGNFRSNGDSHHLEPAYGCDMDFSTGEIHQFDATLAYETTPALAETFFEHVEELEPEHYDDTDYTDLPDLIPRQEEPEDAIQINETPTLDLLPITLAVSNQVNNKKGKYFYKSLLDHGGSHVMIQAGCLPRDCEIFSNPSMHSKTTAGTSKSGQFVYVHNICLPEFSLT